MFKKFSFYFVALLGAVLLFGCAKDEPEEDDLVFEIFAENYTSDNSAKLAVQDNKTYWVDGEQIWVNGGKYQVYITDPYGNTAIGHRPGEGEARNKWNRVFRSKNFNYFIYPYSAFAGTTDGSEVTSSTKSKVFKVNVPSVYNYSESGFASGSKQILGDLPMVAYKAEENPTSVEFKHITAAITVRVTNNSRDDYIKLDRIELTNSQYQLCGNVQVDFSSGDLVIKTENGTNTIPYNQGSSSTVTLEFNGKCPQITTYKDFQIPILPVGESTSQFTVKVYAKSYKSTENGYVVQNCGYPYEKLTNEGNKGIDRARLGYAPITLNSGDKEEIFASENITITLSDGSSVRKDFYKISNKSELKELSDILDERDNTLRGSEDGSSFINGNYIVTENIDMDGETLVPLHYYNEGGTERVYFYGNNKKISNFKVSSVGEQDPNCCGFFGRTAGDNITIENLTLENATFEIAHTTEKIVTYDANYCSAVGGIYSCVDHDGIVIEDCHVNNVTMGATNGVQSSASSQTDFYAGGIVGAVFSSVTIRDCSVGTVTVDNTKDANSGNLIDQFGAAVARIDVGDGDSKNTYGYITTHGGTADQVPAVIIENFTYDQGETALQFVAGLKNVRYGGLVGNITRGGRLIMRKCSVNHKVIIQSKPSEALFVSGLIGCAKISNKMGVHLRDDCSITGTIVNNAADFTDYSSDQYVISKYCSVIKKVDKVDTYTTLHGNNYIQLLSDQGYECALTCNNTLTVLRNNESFGFRVNDQTF